MHALTHEQARSFYDNFGDKQDKQDKQAFYEEDTLQALAAKWVGGCRPTQIAEYLPPDEWHIRYRNVVVSWGIASEVVIALPVPQTSAD